MQPKRDATAPSERTPKSPSTKTLFAASLCIAAAIIAVCSFTTMGASATDDDFGIGLALSDRYPATRFCLFVNAFLSLVVSSLGHALPNVNWFWAIERLAALAALAVFLYLALLRYRTRPLLPLAAGAVFLLIVPLCTYKGNFTDVAAICTIAGGSVLLEDAADSLPASQRKALIACAVALLAFGFMFRAQSFELYLPFFAAAYGTVLLRAHREGGALPHPARQALPVLAVAVAVLALFAYDAAVWGDGEWKDWKDYNHARSTISDFPMPAYDDVAEELDAMGISENDYAMMRTWMTGDLDAFGTGTLSEVASLADSNGVSSLAAGFPRACGRYLASLAGHSVLPAFMALFVILAAASRRRWSALLPLALAFAASALFTDMGRFPPRVEYMTWAYAFSCTALAATSEGYRKGFARGVGSLSLAAAVASAALLCYVTVPNFSMDEVRWSFDQESYDGASEDPLVAYAESHPGDVYVYDVYAFTSIESAYEKKNLPSAEFLQRNISCGGWGTGAPYWKARNGELGIGSIFKALCENDDFYFVTSREEECGYIETFLKEHYGIDAQAEAVAEPEDGTFVYAFRDSGSAVPPEALPILGKNPATGPTAPA